MSSKAIFIGVNKHEDPSIPELNGAVRDATALWALFTDSLPGLSAKLLVDQAATSLNVKNAISATLADASSEDVVIITFAGHGSSDGSLIMFDTQSNNLAHTGISMNSFAEIFRSSKARVILCILDCCFSGQAPARVLENSARPRNVFEFAGVYGEGRILIAACASDESAWEQPGTGHGLLTYSLIQAFHGAQGTSIQFPDIGGEIVRLARVEGERIGVTQTPVFLGSVQGGLAFPALHRGENFNAAFPSMPAQKIEGQFSELTSFGFSPEVISQLSRRFPSGLNPLQLSAVNDFGILQGNSLLVIAPTSSGKTMIGELSSIQAVHQGKKAVFLLPYRALVNEKYEEFGERYGPIGLRIERCSGDFTDGVATVLSGRYDITFFTYEMFLNMVLNSQRLLSQLGSVVIDEGQFITDPVRGMTVELILALLMRSKHRAINPQLIILSAVIGSLNSFDRWLNLQVLHSNKRPVPLVEGVLDRRGTFQYLDADGATKLNALLAPGDVIQRRDKPSSQDVIVPLAKKLVSNNEKLLIFRNMRGPAQGCAKYLSRELGLPSADSILNALPNHDLTGASADLRECLKGGAAFHNTNLLRAEREAVEKGFRDSSGGIFALAATTTLAAGINTPASTVILAENQFVGEDGRAFTIAEYKNMAGRAGRLGYNETGKSIILADTPMERAQLFQKYILGTPEEVKSSFQSKDLSTWILRLLSQVQSVQANDVPSLLINTFGGYSASLGNPEWTRAIEIQIQRLVNRMINADLAITEGDKLRLTNLGRACAVSSLFFESALRLVELMQTTNITQIPPTNVLAIVQVLEEADGIYTPVMKRGQSESVRLNDVINRYGRSMVTTLQRYQIGQFALWERCKRAAIVYDWINGDPVELLEKRYSTTPFQGAIQYGDIIRITEGTRFYLRSAQQIMAAIFPENSDFLTSLDEILLRLEFGLPSNALPLTKLNVQLNRGQYLTLFNNGFRTVEDIQSLKKIQLQEYLGDATATLLVSKVDFPFQQDPSDEAIISQSNV